MTELSSLEPLAEAQSEQAYVVAIQGDLELIIVNNKDGSKYKLSVGQVNKIRSAHPNKARIYLDQPQYNHTTHRHDKFHYSQQINFKDIWANPTKLNSNPISENIPDSDSSKYFVEFKLRINKAITKYPEWFKTQSKVQATANLMEWLTISMDFNKREAEIAKKF